MKLPLKFAFEGRFFKYTFWNGLDICLYYWKSEELISNVPWRLCSSTLFHPSGTLTTI